MATMCIPAQPGSPPVLLLALTGGQSSYRHRAVDETSHEGKERKSHVPLLGMYLGERNISHQQLHRQRNSIIEHVLSASYKTGTSLDLTSLDPCSGLGLLHLAVLQGFWGAAREMLNGSFPSKNGDDCSILCYASRARQQLRASHSSVS